jgi:hypothetical protein
MAAAAHFGSASALSPPTLPQPWLMTRDVEAGDVWTRPRSRIVVLCDGCDRDVFSVRAPGLEAGRWHCAHCLDFDLCADCHRGAAHAQHVADHAFLHLPAPVPRALASLSLLPPQLRFSEYARFVRRRAGALCDRCDVSITGTRFSCTACDDFDLCAGCYCEDAHVRGCHEVRVNEPHPCDRPRCRVWQLGAAHWPCFHSTRGMRQCRCGVVLRGVWGGGRGRCQGERT